ncbi:MAG: thioredoxin family protein [Candidatus Bathyarchaeia archaeon]|jgi:thiol-disulfide isomerase/thioredoxin
MIKVDDKQGLNEELKKDEKILALFYASWCPYCIRFVPVFQKKTGGFNGAAVIHVMLDDYDNPLWDDYDVKAVPTIIFFEKGVVSKRLDGKFGVGLTEKQLDNWLKQL